MVPRQRRGRRGDTGAQGPQGDQGEQGAPGEDGDSFFQGAPTLSEDGAYYTFTLADGTSFDVPRYTGIKVDFGDTTSLLITFGETKTVNFTADGSESFTTDNLFTVAPYGWKVSAALTRAAGTAFSLTVTAPAGATSGAAEGEILVMLDNGQGSTTIGRLKVATYSPEGNELTVNGLQPGDLHTAIGDLTNLTSITVTSGTLDETDWVAITTNKGSLVTIDLAGATYTGTDSNNLVYKGDNSENTTLTTVKLPQGVTVLGSKAFRSCSALTTVTLPEGLTTIGENAFYYCDALTSIDLPSTLTSIGSDAFYSCKALTPIDLPEGLKSIGSSAFFMCEALASIDLPDGLTSIGEWAFGSCALTSIDLPEGVTSIGRGTFQLCRALTSIDLPEGLESIGVHAFDDCDKLSSITLPGTLTSLRMNAFSDCDALTSVTCLGTEVIGMDAYGAFGGCPSSLIIYVPAELEDDYKVATGWINYKDKIQAIQQ